MAGHSISHFTSTSKFLLTSPISPSVTSLRLAEHNGTNYTHVTQRRAQVHGVRQQRSLMANLLERMVQARDIYTAAREADDSRLSAATEAARALFSEAGARDFAASFSRE